VLKIAVCIKQIPLVEEANFDATTKTIKRDGPNVISAYDLRAISLAVELKNRHGAETTVVTMGPPQARAALSDALAMGMDRAVHLEDRAFAGADTLATARALAIWLAREKFDLILLGKYSLDAETGQVGPEIAELIGAAQITGARKLELDGTTLRAERESDEGFEEVEAAMPAVITCAERIAAPIKVKPGASDEAKTKPIISVRATELGADPKEFGLAGSPTWVQEGIAQWMEGKRSGVNAPLLLKVYDANQAMPLKDLEGPWMRLPDPIAAYAYAWALANIEYIVQVNGMSDAERILERIAAGSTTEAAVREVLHSDYADLMQSTAQYLRKTYGN